MHLLRATFDTIVTLDRLPDLARTDAPNGRALTPGFMAFAGLLLGDGNVFAGSVSIARSNAAPYMDYYRAVAEVEFVAGGRAMPSGERHHSARLTAQDVEEIRAALDAGEPMKAIAARYDVATSTVSMISGGHNWGVAKPSRVRPIYLREADRQTRFSSVNAAEELRELGFSGTARTKRVPGWVYGVSEELRLAFVAGFLDADGSVDNKGRMSFHSVSADLLDDIRHLCIGLGIPVTNARRSKISTTLPNGEVFHGEISAFTCSDPGQNRRVPTATPGYTERFMAGRPFDRKDRNYPRFGGTDFNEKGCGLARVASIEEESAETVYDLTVQGTHNFVADGVVVHNSNIEHQAIEVVVDSVSPWVKRFEDEADYKLFGQNRQGLYTKMNMRALLRGDNAARMAFYKGMWEVGAYTPNRILELEDENTIGKDGDKHLVQLNLTTLEQAGAQPVAPVAPPPVKPAAPPADEANAVAQLRALAETPLVPIEPLAPVVAAKRGPMRTRVTKHDDAGRILEYVQEEVS
jgi:hypothetical protein